MSNQIYIINGPNLNYLNLRENEIYGNISLKEIKNKCKKICSKKNINLKFYQSNYEGKIIDLIQKAIINQVYGIVINPAAYSHNSIAILDCIKMCKNIPVIEVHISNIYAREFFRNSSYISNAVNSVISGCGINSYYFAVLHILHLNNIKI